MDIQSIKRKRYVYLFASAISFLVLGLVYGWSLFATPLAEIYGWEMSSVKMTFTFCMMAFCVGGLIGVKVLKGLGLRGAILLAAALLVCGFGGTAQAFVPLDMLDGFRDRVEASLGRGCCHVVRIRPAGGIRLG